MPITVVCNGCGKSYRLADQAAGKKVRCRACGQDMLVPGPGAEPMPTRKGDEEDPFEALVAMERNASPAGRGASPNRRLQAIAPAEPVDVEDEPSRPKEKRPRPPGRFGRRSSGAIGTDNITPWLVIAFIAAQLAAAIIQTVHASHAPAQVHSKVVGLAWATGILNIVILFALLGPAIFLGAFVSSKILNYRMVDLGYLRGCAIAALPGLLLFLVALLPPSVVPQGMRDTIDFVVLVLLIPITFLTLRFVFDLDWVGAAVAYVLAAPLWFAASALAAAVVTAAVLTQFFGNNATAQAGHFYSFYNTDQFAGIQQAPPEKGNPKKEAVPANAEAELAAKKTQTEDNLRQIGQAAQRFAQAGDGKQFPPTLEAMVTAGDLPADRVNSPFQSSKIGGYTYLSGRASGVPSNVVLAYDEAERASQGGTHVLFANGNVEWCDATRFATAVAQSDQALSDWQTQQREVERKRQEEMIAKQSAPRAPANADQPAAPPAAPKPQDFVGRFTADKSPLVASVTAAPIAGDVYAIIESATTSPFVMVIRGGPAGTQDAVEVWDLVAGQKKGEATFAHEAGFQTAYAMNPAGTLLARTVNFPKLQVRVWSVKEEKETRTIALNERLGTPSLAGFLDAERLAVRWTQRGLEGLEVWNVASGRVLRQVPLQPYERSATNGVFSPDGRTYGFTTAKIPPRPPRVGKIASLEFYDMVSSVTARRSHEITEVAAEDVDTPAGTAFSPDGKRFAALFVKQGLGVIVIWRVSDGKSIGSYEVAVAPDAVPAGRNAAGPGLAWVHNGAALLVEGNTLVDASSGKTLGVLNAPPSTGQRALANDVLAFTYQEDGNSRVAVVTLAGAKPAVTTTAPADGMKH